MIPQAQPLQPQRQLPPPAMSPGLHALDGGQTLKLSPPARSDPFVPAFIGMCLVGVAGLYLYSHRKEISRAVGLARASRAVDAGAAGGPTFGQRAAATAARRDAIAAEGVGRLAAAVAAAEEMGVDRLLVKKGRHTLQALKKRRAATGAAPERKPASGRPPAYPGAAAARVTALAFAHDSQPATPTTPGGGAAAWAHDDEAEDPSYAGSDPWLPARRMTAHSPSSQPQTPTSPLTPVAAAAAAAPEAPPPPAPPPPPSPPRAAPAPPAPPPQAAKPAAVAAVRAPSPPPTSQPQPQPQPLPTTPTPAPTPAPTPTPAPPPAPTPAPTPTAPPPPTAPVPAPRAQQQPAAAAPQSSPLAAAAELAAAAAAAALRSLSPPLRRPLSPKAPRSPSAAVAAAAAAAALAGPLPGTADAGKAPKVVVVRRSSLSRPPPAPASAAPAPTPADPAPPPPPPLLPLGPHHSATSSAAELLAAAADREAALAGETGSEGEEMPEWAAAALGPGLGDYLELSDLAEMGRPGGLRAHLPFAAAAAPAAAPGASSLGGVLLGSPTTSLAYHASASTDSASLLAPGSRTSSAFRSAPPSLDPPPLARPPSRADDPPFDLLASLQHIWGAPGEPRSPTAASMAFAHPLDPRAGSPFLAAAGLGGLLPLAPPLVGAGFNVAPNGSGSVRRSGSLAELGFAESTEVE
jgi:hypothetical protein